MSHDHSECCRNRNCGECHCCEIRIIKASGKTKSNGHGNGNGGGTDRPVLRCWLCIVVWIITIALAVIGLLALSYYWTIQREALAFPAYPLRCDAALAVSDSNSSGIEPATRITTTPTLALQPVIATAVNSAVGLNDPALEDEAEEARSAGMSRGPGQAYDPKRVERAARHDIADFDGSPWAAGIRRGYSLSDAENADVPRRFRILNETEGVLGFHRLGRAYLGRDAFNIVLPGPGNLHVEHCPGINYVQAHHWRAYKYFALVEKACRPLGVVNSPDDTQAWLDAMRAYYPNSTGAFDRIDQNIEQILTDLMKRRARDRDPLDPQQRAEFCRGLPDSGETGDLVTCDNTTKSRQALKLGDAALANTEIELARVCWRRAVTLAQGDPASSNSENPNPDVFDPDNFDPDGVASSIIAQQRLQNYATTCKFTPTSLARISRDYKAYSGDLLPVPVLQRALAALGHYEGGFDGEFSPRTRAAIRKFQRQREEDETDTLTPLQMTLLVCNAAETPGDSYSKNTLGLMYGAGLGVEQNTDQALNWLKDAANRKQPDATYNLAILYGTGIILNSYRLCDVPRTPEQADKYLQEAAYLGNARAQEMMATYYGPHSTYGRLSPRERWALIEAQLFTGTGRYANRLSNIGASCAPDRSIR